MSFRIRRRSDSATEELVETEYLLSLHTRELKVAAIPSAVYRSPTQVTVSLNNFTSSAVKD
jgi:hypothetical protein